MKFILMAIFFGKKFIAKIFLGGFFETLIKYFIFLFKQIIQFLTTERQFYVSIIFSNIFKKHVLIFTLQQKN